MLVLVVLEKLGNLILGRVERVSYPAKIQLCLMTSVTLLVICPGVTVEFFLLASSFKKRLSLRVYSFVGSINFPLKGSTPARESP